LWRSDPDWDPIAIKRGGTLASTPHSLLWGRMIADHSVTPDDDIPKPSIPKRKIS